MKKCFLIILSLFFFVNVQANSYVTATYRTIAFNSKGETILAGESLGYGFVIKIKKNNKVTTQITDIGGLSKIIYLDERNGWLSTWSEVFQTVDGTTWTKQSSPIDRRIHLIDFIDKNRGWVAGDNENDYDASLYKTDDGGRSWEKLNLPQDVMEVRKMKFFDEAHGWILTFNGFHCGSKCLSVFRTDDGGKSWSEVVFKEKVPNDWFDMHFVDYWNGVALGQNLYSTTDGGKNWQIVDNVDEDYSLNKITFLNETKGWTWGKDFLETNDGGKSWKHFKPNGFEEDFDEVKFMNEQVGWAVSYYASQKAAYFTRDGGKNWTMFPDKWKNKIFEKTYKKAFPDNE